MNKDIKKILLIRNDKIGDMILSSWIINVIKTKFPDAKIDMVVSDSNKELVEKDKNLDKIYTVKYSPRSLSQFLEYFKISEEIRKERYDIGIEIRGSFFNIFFLLFLGRVRYKIGLYTNILSKLFLNYSYFKSFKGHAIKSMATMIKRGLDIDFENPWPNISVCEEDKISLDNFIKKNKIKKSISLCIDASSKSKQLSLEKWEGIIGYLSDKYTKYKILLVGIDKDKIDFLSKKNRNCILAYNKNLRFLFLLFKKNNLIIAPDGGMMHLAWAAKSNLIALIPKFVRVEDSKPLGKNSHIIYKNVNDIKIIEIKNLIDKILEKN